MLFLKQFKAQFLSFIRNDFSGLENGQDTTEPALQNAHDLIKSILDDGRLDGDDLNEIKSLKDIMESDESEIYSKSREGLNSLLLDTLNNGYSVSSDSDYLALKKMLYISNSNLNLPNDYSSLSNSLGVNSFSLTLNHQGNGFYVYNQDSSYKGKLGFILGGALTLQSGISRDISTNNNQIGKLSPDLLNTLNSAEQAAAEQAAAEQAAAEQAAAEQAAAEQAAAEQAAAEQAAAEQAAAEQAAAEQAVAEQAAAEQAVAEQASLEQQSFNSAKRFYERIGANPYSIEGLQAALILNGENLPVFGADGSFGKETFEAIKSFQAKNNLTVDGLAGEKTLFKLGILFDGENLKDYYSIKGPILNEPSLVESGQDEILNNQEESIDNTESMINLSERFNSIKLWIKEIFSSNPVIGEFVGGNGKKIKLNYVESNNSIHVNTPFFDGISDFPLSDIPSIISSKEDAELYVLSKIKEIKENYDVQVLNRAINMVSRRRFDNDNNRNNNISYKIDNFDSAGRKIDISLVSRFDISGNHKGYFLQVNTPFRDGVRDSEVTIDINNINDISEIKNKTQDLKEKYTQLFNERNSK